MTSEQATHPARRRHLQQFLKITSAVLAALVLLGGGGLYLVSEHLTGNITMIPSVFGPISESERPPKPAPEPAGRSTTILLAGSDSRSSDSEADTEKPFVPGAQRSDALMLVRISADRTQAAVVSIPRDSWVPVPGRGMAKINAALSWGGPTLMVRTIEALTGVRIDHYATIDFSGFQRMIDAVGGVDVDVAASTSIDDVTFHAGINHLNGHQALAYVRQRHGLLRGDLDRVQRQQNVLRALITKISSAELLSDPVSLFNLLDALTKSVGIDDTLGTEELRTFVYGLRNMSPDNIIFLTAPVSGLGREGAQSVVYLDGARAARLWRAINHDDVGSYARDNSQDVLGGTPR